MCEYYDASKQQIMKRSYVVWLQHRVRELEEELEKVENEDAGEDPEAMVRGAAAVRVHDASDSKYLGPSSGIAITRLVMQLAKQFTDAKSITEIVPDQRARQIRELYHQEQAKPTSKVYPLISDVAAVDLPHKPLTDLLVQLYKLKVQPMYPALHEPTLDKDLDTVYHANDRASSHQHFICRMVIAISLQKMDTQYAGLADSYYLAALKYLEPVVKPMDLNTLQCLCLMAEYSTLTPTRTAAYYVVGMAVRLAQALGYHEEKTVTRGTADGRVDYLEIDMRRRLFWCIFVMECGLAHTLGRPAILATSQEHIDVGWFETCDDKYITPAGVDPVATRPTFKKWIAIHFFKMRLLQLEIRRKLYQRKRPDPKDDSDPWFRNMDAKLTVWSAATPSQDEGSGLNKAWFAVRYNTMIVMLYRPSPQVPRPSLEAALKCFDACKYNIYAQREQLISKSAELSWVFAQAIFMAINTMLWSLSYSEVRKRHSKAAVERHLDVAMECIQLASERWPGVLSAVQLYQNLIAAIVKVYEKDSDVPLSAVSPSEVASPALMFPDPSNHSQTTSPATVGSSSIPTPPERPAPFGYFQQRSRRSVKQSLPVPCQSDLQMPQPQTQPTPTPPAQQTPPFAPQAMHPIHNTIPPSLSQQSLSFDPSSYANPLPEWAPELTVPSWSGPSLQPFQYQTGMAQPAFNGYANNTAFDPNYQGYSFPGVDTSVNDQYMPQYWDMDFGSLGSGLNQDQQQELMHSLENEGMEDIQSMITSTAAVIEPQPASRRTS